MRAHVRLAERQGLLQGRHISPPQAYALIVLNHLDEIDRAKGNVQQLKHSLVASGSDYKTLFPEYAPPPKEVDLEDEAVQDANWDYSAVEWKSPSEDPEAFEKLMAHITNSRNVMTGDDVVTDAPPEQIEWTDWR